MSKSLDDGGTGQNLKIYIDSDRDGDFADETTLLNTDSIDNDWSTWMFLELL